MKQIFRYTLIILTFHLLVLLIPVIVFLISLSQPGISILNTFRWFYLPLVFLSPVLILTLCYRIACHQATRPWMAVISGFIGFSPIWLSYLALATPWNLRDLGIVIFSPIFLSLIAVVMTKFTNKPSC